MSSGLPTRPNASRARHPRRTVALVTAAVVVVGGGVGAAVALQPRTAPTTAPSPAPSVTPSPSAPSPATSVPRPSTPATDPLTGGKPSGREVIAVKVENIAAARPQAGLGAADIVFVEEVEASLTRLVAVYHSSFPDRVGPVRSARNTDVELLPLFGRPGLVYSGANRKVESNIQKASITPLQRTTRDNSRVVPHNVFVDLDKVADSAKAGRAQSIGWTFAARDPRWSAAAKEGKPTGRVGGDAMSFDYGGGRYTVLWKGQPYAGTVKADNVLVMKVKTRPDGNADVNGVRSVKSSTVGSGQVTIYRDGRKLTGTWQRAGRSKPMRLLDAKGQDLPLKPGRTWVLLSG